MDRSVDGVVIIIKTYIINPYQTVKNPDVSRRCEREAEARHMSLGDRVDRFCSERKQSGIAVIRAKQCEVRRICSQPFPPAAVVRLIFVVCAPIGCLLVCTKY